MVILLLSLTLGCKGDKTPPQSSADPEPVAEVADASEGGDPEADDPEADREEADATATADSAALYEECKERVEKPEADGECSADDDCFKAGCSREVCTAKSNAMDVMTACDQQPCFEVLDVCGCVEGRCTWSLKEDVVVTPKEDLPQ